MNIINKMEKLKVASFFSGAGGLDLGFENAGFDIIYANDNWKGCWETFEKNHGLKIDKRSITDIKPAEIPEVIGFVGGPPCQSWSLAGAMRGIKDPRGKLFYNYINLIDNKKPLFFLAENVAGIISKANISEFKKILNEFKKIGYNVEYKLLNAKDFNVPEDRKRVIIIGYREDLNKRFDFNKIHKFKKINLRKTIKDMPPSTPAINQNKPNSNLKIINHEHYLGGFSPIFLSRNRRKSWNDISFTIQAGPRHIPIHPNAPKMINIGIDKWAFKNESSKKIRRLSIRECARIQTFPDDFIFYYDTLDKGYKMIGNAVPIKFAEAIAKVIKEDLKDVI